MATEECGVPRHGTAATSIEKGNRAKNTRLWHYICIILHMLLFKKNYCYFYFHFIYVFNVSRDTRVSQCACGGQRTICRTWSSPSTSWSPGLRSGQRLGSRPFPHEPLPDTCLLCQQRHTLRKPPRQSSVTECWGDSGTRSFRRLFLLSIS